MGVAAPSACRATKHRHATEGTAGLMMNQEEYVDLHALKNEGWTNKEIADELGFHPATIAR